MKNSLFDINRFNIIQDEENYYFFRALNMADNITTSKNGKIEKIRIDRERFDGETNTLKFLKYHLKKYMII